MTEQEGIRLYRLWMKAWNEDVSVLDRITAPDCIVHQARSDGASTDHRKGAEALKGIISDGSAFFDVIQVDVVVGPIADGPYVSARWKFAGTFKGGMPGTTAKAGERVAFHGIDIFRLSDGRLQEYWVSSDGIDLMKQLGVF